MSPANRQVMLNIPNLMTLARILAIPVIVALLMMQGPHRSFESNRLLSFIAAGLFILAAISDVVDGYIARKIGQVSVMGKFFDPMADKLVHMAVMVVMIPMGRFPAWLCVVLLFREILITGLRAIAAGEGLIIGADQWGKKKTVWLNIGLSGMIIYYPFLGLNPYLIGWVAVGISAVYSLYSGVQYMVYFFKTISAKQH